MTAKWHFNLTLIIFTVVVPIVHSTQLLPRIPETRKWREYCETETFEPECSAHDVIVMTAAEYGRMQMGKCVEEDYGYVGCRSDVLTHLDSKCSGRRSCLLTIPDPTLDETKPCPKSFKTYMNATYKCVKVESAACQRCVKSTYARVTLPRAYIASVVTSESDYGCGSARCPWLIEVQVGQKINITAYDFGLSHKTSRSYGTDLCFRYAVIKEKAAHKATPVCGGQHREAHVYTSLTNSVEIHVVSPQVFKTKGHFLFYYEAVGCPEYPRPQNTWVRREDDRLMVGCLSTDAKWSLKCKGTTWEGQIGTCPEDLSGVVGPQNQEKHLVSLSLGILVAIVSGIALVIGVLILTIGVVCLKRQQHVTCQRPPSTMYIRAQHDANFQEEFVGMCPLNPKATTPEADKQQLPLSTEQRENVYARRMEARPLPSLPNLAEESKSDDDVDRTKVLVHRANSGKGQPARGATRCAHGSKDDPQYFVLDPDDAVDDEHATARRHARESNKAASPQDSHQKSPEEENAENFNKEVHLNNSCHEIPLRPSREGSQQTRTESDSGNSSWP